MRDRSRVRVPMIPIFHLAVEGLKHVDSGGRGQVNDIKGVRVY